MDYVKDLQDQLYHWNEFLNIAEADVILCRKMIAEIERRIKIYKESELYKISPKFRL